MCEAQGHQCNSRSGAVRQHNEHYARREAQQGWNNARREAPNSPVRGRRDTGHLQHFGRRVAAHSLRDKACNTALGHVIDKGDAARNEVQHMEALPCARHKAISAIAARRGSIMRAMPDARSSKAGTMLGARCPATLHVGRRDTGHLQRVGRRATAHSPRDKACDAPPGHDIYKGDAARCNKRPKLTSHFN
ncbi:hypothetical protein HAX54_043482 [Datura stramonium]|uniref:Uncharacterized protein n=1 Tax=Datura stramonium TaxID=4076 RepID=A0ABS8W4L0_DATST|nr:hypothetical protein [Datura stramonium]